MRYSTMDRIRPSAEQQIRGDAGMVSETETGRDKSAVRRVVVVVGDPSLRNLIRNRLSRDARYRVEMTNSAATPHLPFTTRGADAVLLGLTEILSLGRRKSKLLDDLRRYSKVLLLLRRSELVQSLEIASRCDGFVFVDLNMERLAEIIDLALWGYCMIPPTILSELTSHQLRLDLIQELRRDELQVLALLGRGMTNRAISGHIGLPESTVKNIVRSVLKKLHFRNRTEAAVFAFVHRISIQPWADMM